MSKAVAVGARVTFFCFETGRAVVEKDVLKVLRTLTLALFHRNRESLAPFAWKKSKVYSFYPGIRRNGSFVVDTVVSHDV